MAAEPASGTVQGRDESSGVESGQMPLKGTVFFAWKLCRNALALKQKSADTSLQYRLSGNFCTSQYGRIDSATYRTTRSVDRVFQCPGGAGRGAGAGLSGVGGNGCLARVRWLQPVGLAGFCRAGRDDCGLRLVPGWATLWWQIAGFAVQNFTVAGLLYSADRIHLYALGGHRP